MGEFSLHKKPDFTAALLKKKLNTLGWRLFRFALLFSLCFVVLYPLIYIISISFRDIRDFADVSVKWVTKTWTMNNIKDVFMAMNYPKTIMNTFLISTISSLFLIASCSLAGYGFARFRFKLKNILFGLVLFSIIVPPQTYIMPMFVNYRFFDFFGIGSLAGLFTGQKVTVNLLNSWLTIILPAVLGNGLRAGLYIVIFRQFFRGLPKELEDAAYIDGCGFLGTYIKVMFPNSTPAVLTVFLFSFVWYWNDFLQPSMLLANAETLTVAFLNIEGILYSWYNVLPDVNTLTTRTYAGSLMLIAPLIIIYVLLQRYFTESIERTGIVG